MDVCPVCGGRNIVGVWEQDLTVCVWVCRDCGNKTEMTISDRIETSMTTFREELTAQLNRYSMENGSGTPDHILAEYLLNCLQAFDQAVVSREMWYGKNQEKIDEHRSRASERYAYFEQSDGSIAAFPLRDYQEQAAHTDEIDQGKEKDQP